MVQQDSHSYDFGRFRLKTAERVLLREGEPVPLTPKVFDILITLVENRGQIVEMGTAADVFDSPAHLYTRALLSAIPSLTPVEGRLRVVYDSAAHQRLPLTEIASGHFAAVGQ